MQFVLSSFLLVAGLMFLQGCFEKKEVNVEQPMQFNHASHTRYFLDGNHKAENIKWHLDELDEEEAPTELIEGNCLECHETFEDQQNCGGCHLIFQDEKAKKNRAQRPCLGCHRAAWTGYKASIPTIEVCKSCHMEKLLTTSDQEKILQKYIKAGEDIPWVQINTLVDNVHFSHIAHIRFAGLACINCHPQDMRKQSKPPDEVLVFSMSSCIGCHEQSQANNDCLTCHK
jgi:hypothetical protein